MENEIMVSICCITYNHEKYIADAIDGFMMQKIDFTYEILIYDDASTDKTAEIIKKYEEKYPQIIKPVYQTENQYSKGISLPFMKYLYPRANGKYIANCEGDDYWTDPYKLQKQIEYMERNPGCTFCFTNAKIIRNSRDKRGRLFVPFEKANKKFYSSVNKKYNLGELALLGFIPTATFVFPTVLVKDISDFNYENAPVVDLFIKLYTTLKGYAYYINDVTSVYRMNVPGSFTTECKYYNVEQKNKLSQGFIDLVEAMDEYSKFQYTMELNQLKAIWEINILVAKKDKNVFKIERFKKRFKEISLKNKTKIVLAVYFPSLHDLFRRLRKAVIRKNTGY